MDDGDHIPASDDSLPIHRLAAKAEIKQQQDDDPKGNYHTSAAYKYVHYVTIRYIMLHCDTSYYDTLSNITLHYIVVSNAAAKFRISSHYFSSDHITSPRITSLHIILISSYNITFHHIACVLGNKSAIVLLSTAANIISCHTSMVGVDKGRKELVKGKMTKRRVPLMMSRAVPSPAGWLLF